MRFAFRVVSVPLALAVVVAVAWGMRAPRVSASLYDLIGAEAKRIPSFLRDASASEVAIIVSSADADQAHAAAKRLAAEFPVSTDLPSGALDFIRENRGGLVTRETAELLRTHEGRAKIAKRAIRRLYSSPLPPVLGYGDDPFGLTDAWLLSFASARTQKTAEGWPSLTTNGVTQILLRHRLVREAMADIDRTIVAVETLEGFCSRFEGATGMSPQRVCVRLAGAPVHAAISARRCKGEIGWLTWFSLVFIAALALFVFRSLRWLPLFAASLAVSALAGGIALVAAFREIHLMTIVFGTTVMGLVIDYSFHWLLSCEDEKPTVVRNLAVSFLTTEISLVPLMLSSVPVLRQSAVFLGTGLAAALAFVLSAYPRGASCDDGQQAYDNKGLLSRCSSRRALVVVRLLFFLIALVGVFFAELRTDMTALYRPPAKLLKAEKARALFGTFDFSRLPSLDERRAIAANVRLLYAEHGAALAQTLGERELLLPPEPRTELLAPQKLMTAVLSDWTREAVRRLVVALSLMFGVLILFYRRRAFRIFMPSAFALFAVAGLLGLARIPINLFHLLAGFLLAGMSIDYTVFLHGGGRGVLRPALCSLLTSMAGFGALAFVSFPVIQSFGIVLGVGLPVAFVTALSIRGRDGATARRRVHTEHGASLLGMETLFVFYRVFGLRVLHLLSACVGLCVWLFSPAVRRASPSLKKVVNFTRSLADKLVVLAEGRNLPRVETDGSSDADAFVKDVQDGKGVFILSSHVGTVEVLMALGECDRTFHAWMDVERTGVFNRFYLRHAKRRRVVIHPISSFGMGTVFEAGDWIDSGDCLVMAGDRGEGAFRFAAAFGHPVYFVACLAERGCRYRAVIRRLPGERRKMKAAYEAILSDLVGTHADQHFAWAT